EYEKLIKYFLASLTIPNSDMWVNLSPHESNRIIPDNFAETEMGRDLLGQDYILKQLTASLIYPEDEVGKKFWQQVYSQAFEKFGTIDIPVDTFNKVWIMADKAKIYQKNDTAFLVKSHLKVMMEQDFMAISSNKEQFGNVSAQDAEVGTDESRKMAADIVREVIVPVIEKEVNEGENFAQVRQIYSAMIMATWFKKALKESLLGQVYADKSKVAGIEVNDPQAKEKIYKQYLEAYKVGVFNYIKEETDPVTREMLPRKYFSGGALAVRPEQIEDAAQADAAEAVRASGERLDAAQVSLLSRLANGLLGLIGRGQPAAPAAKQDAEAPATGREFTPEQLGDIVWTILNNGTSLEDIELAFGHRPGLDMNEQGKRSEFFQNLSNKDRVAALEMLVRRMGRVKNPTETSKRELATMKEALENFALALAVENADGAVAALLRDSKHTPHDIAHADKGFIPEAVRGKSAQEVEQIAFFLSLSVTQRYALLLKIWDHQMQGVEVSLNRTELKAVLTALENLVLTRGVSFTAQVSGLVGEFSVGKQVGNSPNENTRRWQLRQRQQNGSWKVIGIVSTGQVRKAMLRSNYALLVDPVISVVLEKAQENLARLRAELAKLQAKLPEIEKNDPRHVELFRGDIRKKDAEVTQQQAEIKAITDILGPGEANDNYGALQEMVAQNPQDQGVKDQLARVDRFMASETAEVNNVQLVAVAAATPAAADAARPDLLTLTFPSEFTPRLREDIERALVNLKDPGLLSLFSGYSIDRKEIERALQNKGLDAAIIKRLLMFADLTLPQRTALILQSIHSLIITEIRAAASDAERAGLEDWRDQLIDILNIVGRIPCVEFTLSQLVGAPDNQLENNDTLNNYFTHRVMFMAGQYMIGVFYGLSLEMRQATLQEVIDMLEARVQAEGRRNTDLNDHLQDMKKMKEKLPTIEGAIAISLAAITAVDNASATAVRKVISALDRIRIESMKIRAAVSQLQARAREQRMVAIGADRDELKGRIDGFDKAIELLGDSEINGTLGGGDIGSLQKKVADVDAQIKRVEVLTGKTSEGEPINEYYRNAFRAALEETVEVTNVMYDEALGVKTLISDSVEAPRTPGTPLLTRLQQEALASGKPNAKDVSTIKAAVADMRVKSEDMTESKVKQGRIDGFVAVEGRLSIIARNGTWGAAEQAALEDWARKNVDSTVAGTSADYEAGYRAAVAEGIKAANPVGGINLSDENLTMEIKTDGQGMPLPAQMQDPAMVNIQGLSPVIRDIAPVSPATVPVLSAMMQASASAA
ncbi:MAG: hypothetical protein HQL18_00960, partial [Candidatus Omnitrophica bacterium]|nr:hypothetical protein [Candidatus Omnitrophota bacterium]